MMLLIRPLFDYCDLNQNLHRNAMTGWNYGISLLYVPMFLNPHYLWSPNRLNCILH